MVLRGSPWRTFWTVTIPGARYGLVSAAFVVFNLVITDFGLPKVIGGQFNVLAGLVPTPIIAVPAPQGYGVAENGRVALDAALGSCAPGLTVVNIGNGFGAACAAIRIMRVGAGS